MKSDYDSTEALQKNMKPLPKFTTSDLNKIKLNL